jgi:RNA-directed DNA polymerase
VKTGRSEGPKNQETDQPNKLWQPERVVTRNSLGATKSTSQTAQEEKEEWNSTGTERGGASPEPGEKRYKKVLNEMIMDQILSRENLNAAYLAVKANDGAPGVDGMSITELKEQVRKHWGTLERKLKAGEYQPAAVRAVEIPKANGGKRTLGIPTVLDRLIQQAIHQVLSPIFEEGFSEHSYGFRAGRSAHDAVRAAQEYVKTGKRWVVDIDLKAFFDQVDHDKLMHLVGQRIRDKAVLKLIGKYLRAPMQRAEKNEARSKGTPQGGPLSPLLANIYLDPLDKELEKRAVSFVRYADDIAIYASSQRSAERIKESVIRWLSKELKLEVNRAKSGAGPTEQSGLLGFRIDQEGNIEIGDKAIQRLKERVRELWDALQGKTSEELRQQWKQYISGWWNYFQLAENRREIERLSGWIRRHIRKCFWQRWHGSQGRQKALQKLGISGPTLSLAKCTRGAWRMAAHHVMQKALSNRTLQRYGFIIPWQDATAN